ncbi:predicted protein [Naegleria gruberi]|uniref:Predicted protein n=1 Tax=Naegleria gruberi TaxID=5762 RepID=D2W337_NAEGR|nr:uncharacterized protein NAEGRDRAFT_75808 [Naegleria gruberi]EFC36545.1 predicted protein [Naegleria gruberi]|eukprot:XP_002669289.1 predicted protein [Naegleria gruberi strain NEG-M]
MSQSTEIIDHEGIQVEWPLNRKPFFNLLELVEHYGLNNSQSTFLTRVITDGELPLDYKLEISTLTFGQFSKSVAMARRLIMKQWPSLKKGSCVALLHENSIVYSVLLFALWTLGCINFPVNNKLTPGIISKLLELGNVKYVSLSPQILDSMIKASDKESMDTFFKTADKYMITSDISQQLKDYEKHEYSSYLKPFDIISAIKDQLDTTISDEDLKQALKLPFKFEDPCFYLNTSGSTNIPKIVIHNMRSLMSSLHYSQSIGTTSQQYVINFLPLFHLMGLYNLLGCLYKGTNYIMFNQTTRQSISQTLSQVLLSHKEHLPSTRAIVFPILLEEIMESEEKTKLLSECLVVALGGVSTPNHLINYCQDHRINITNGYGMSEVGVVMAADPFTGAFKSMKCVIPEKYIVWQPYEMEKCYLLNLKKGCPTCALDYMSINNTKFWVDGIFCTHDLFFEYPKDHYFYNTRSDNILCHTNGEMTNPVPIENEIDSFDGSVVRSAVIGHNRPFCVALIEIDPKKKPNNIKEKISEQIIEMNNRLPFHSRIVDFILLTNDSIPTSSLKGLVSRSKTEQVFKNIIDSLYNVSSSANENENIMVKKPQSSKKASKIAEPSQFLEFMNKQIFINEENAIELNTSLTNIGLDSISLIKLRNYIKNEFNVQLSVDEVYKMNTPKKLIEAINQSELLTPVVNEEIMKYLEKSKESLPQSISSSQPLIHEQVLLTGSTGFLGAFLLRDLLELQELKMVYCICRGNSIDHATKRLIDNMKKYSLWKNEYISRVQVLVGDVGLDLFGMDRATYDELARNVDVVYHGGSVVNFIQPFSSLKESNVDGTRRMIEFSFQSRVKPLLYVSSISAAPLDKDSGQPIERISTLSEMNLTFGYPQTKFASECLLKQAKDILGLPILIVRPGLIIGNETGEMPKGFLLERMLKSIKRTNSTPNLEIVRNLVNVDFVSKIIVNSTRFKLFDLEIIHICNTNPPTHEELLNHLKTNYPNLYGKVEETSFDNFLSNVTENDKSDDGMYPLSQWAKETLQSGKKDSSKYSESVIHLKQATNRLKELNSNLLVEEMSSFSMIDYLIKCLGGQVEAQ